MAGASATDNDGGRVGTGNVDSSLLRYSESCRGVLIGGEVFLNG
jgi:hypothetical protein